MEVEEDLEVPPPEETNMDPSTQIPQLQWQGDETMQEEYPMHGKYPSQEGTSSQGGPLAWVSSTLVN